MEVRKEGGFIIVPFKEWGILTYDLASHNRVMKRYREVLSLVKTPRLPYADKIKLERELDRLKKVIAKYGYFAQQVRAVIYEHGGVFIAESVYVYPKKEEQALIQKLKKIYNETYEKLRELEEELPPFERMFYFIKLSEEEEEVKKVVILVERTRSEELKEFEERLNELKERYKQIISLSDEKVVRKKLGRLRYDISTLYDKIETFIKYTWRKDLVDSAKQLLIELDNLYKKCFM